MVGVVYSVAETQFAFGYVLLINILRMALPSFYSKKGRFSILRTPEITQGAYELNRSDPLLFSHKSKLNRRTRSPEELAEPKNPQPRRACKSHGATPQLHRHRRTHGGSHARTAAPVLPEQCLRLAGPAALLCPSASVIRRLLKRDRRHSHGAAVGRHGPAWRGYTKVRTHTCLFVLVCRS